MDRLSNFFLPRKLIVAASGDDLKEFLDNEESIYKMQEKASTLKIRSSSFKDKIIESLSSSPATKSPMMSLRKKSTKKDSLVSIYSNKSQESEEEIEEDLERNKVEIMVNGT